MDSINPKFSIKKRTVRTKHQLVNGLKQKNKFILSEVITLLESEDVEKKTLGLDVLKALYTTDEKKSIRIGITGSPGVGKSTFINAYARFLHEQGKSVAVLAVDPTSQPTSGSILGDKTRMSDLTNLERVYIRPSPAGNVLGGIAKGTREAMTACELAGYDVILVETVGVGQSEHLATQMVDVTILLLQMGAGDDIQGIKRGIMEMADLFVVNKDDGDHKPLVNKALSYYRQALSFIKPKFDTKYARVLSCSSLEFRGFEKIDSSIQKIFQFLENSGLLKEWRGKQNVVWQNMMLREYAIQKVMSHKSFATINRKPMNDIDVLEKFTQFKNKLDELFQD